MIATMDAAFDSAAHEFQMSTEELKAEGLRLVLTRRLREVDAKIFEITGRYDIVSVQEMEAKYETGEIEEADSWRDYQALDHLQYKRKRLLKMIESIG
jgi:hypothetical protein